MPILPTYFNSTSFCTAVVGVAGLSPASWPDPDKKGQTQGSAPTEFIFHFSVLGSR